MNSQSIHPRVQDGRQQFPKYVTSKPYKSGKGKLGKRMRELNRRRNAHSMTIKTHPNGFKTPGSMNEKK